MLGILLVEGIFGLALGYKKNDEYYVVGIKRYEPEKVKYDVNDKMKDLKSKMEINPMQVREELLQIRMGLGCRFFVFDTWAYPLLQKELELNGANVINNIVKTEHHEGVRKLLYAGKLHICYDRVLEKEWKSLTYSSSGKVDHPKDGSKDIADAVANLVFLLDQMEAPVWVPRVMARLPMGRGF